MNLQFTRMFTQDAHSWLALAACGSPGLRSAALFRGKPAYLISRYEDV